MYFFYRNFMMSPQQKIKVTVSKFSVIKWWTTLPKNQCSSHARVISCLCLNCAVRSWTENQDDFLLSVKNCSGQQQKSSVTLRILTACFRKRSWVYNGNEGDWWTKEWFTFCSIFNSKLCGVCPWAAVTSLICSATLKTSDLFNYSSSDRGWGLQTHPLSLSPPQLHDCDNENCSSGKFSSDNY